MNQVGHKHGVDKFLLGTGQELVHTPGAARLGALSKREEFVDNGHRTIRRRTSELGWISACEPRRPLALTERVG